MIFKLHLLQILRLPGDVEVVGAGLYTGLHHALAVEPVGPDAVEDDPGLPRHAEEGGAVTAVTANDVHYDKM